MYFSIVGPVLATCLTLRWNRTTRSSTGSGGFLDAQEDHALCIRAEPCHELRSVEAQEDLLTVPSDKLRAQRFALSPGSMRRFVRFGLPLAQRIRRSQVEEVEVPDAETL